MPQQRVHRPSWQAGFRTGGPVDRSARLTRARTMAMPGRLRHKYTVTGMTSGAQAVAYCPSNDRWYVACADQNVRVINPATGAVVATIALTAGDDPRDIVYGATQDRLYVSAYTNGQIRIINPGTNAVVASVAVASNPKHLTYISDRDHLAVCQYGGSNVVFINCATLGTTTTATFGNPHSGHRAFLTAAEAAANLGLAHGLYVVTSVTGLVTKAIRTDTWAVLNTSTVTFTGGATYPSMVLNAATYHPDSDLAWVLWVLSASNGYGQTIQRSKGNLAAANGDWIGWPSQCIHYDPTRRLFYARSTYILGSTGGTLYTYAFMEPGPRESGNIPQALSPPVVRILPSGSPVAAAGNDDQSSSSVDTLRGDIAVCVTTNLEVVGT